MNRVDKALADHMAGWNCAQAVFAAYSDLYGVEPETARLLTEGLGGGVGCHGEICGALAGAVLALGLRGGRRQVEDDGKAKVRGQVVALENAFRARCGALRCSELTGVDLTLDADAIKAHMAPLRGTRCREIVRAACELLEGAIL